MRSTGDQASASNVKAAYIRIKRCGLCRNHIQAAHCPSQILVIKRVTAPWQTVS
ncbi:MAG: hypothetical protein ABL862_09440 [Candidatus Nitrotoga sp.]